MSEKEFGSLGTHTRNTLDHPYEAARNTRECVFCSEFLTRQLYLTPWRAIPSCFVTFSAS